MQSYLWCLIRKEHQLWKNPFCIRFPTDQQKSFKINFHLSISECSIRYYFPLLIFLKFLKYRWAKLRINMLPATIICEPISECFVASLIIGWAVHHMFRWDIMVFFMCHCLAWFIFDYIQLRAVQVGYTEWRLRYNRISFVN